MDMSLPVDGLSRTLRTVSVAALVAVNLVPVAGVVLWNWDVGALVILYWSENLVLGAYTIVKMLAQSPVGGLVSALFFLIHYGGFCAVHGIFVLALTMDVAPDFIEGEPWPLFLVFVQLLVSVVRQVLAMAPPEWLFAFAALAVSHGISLIGNYFLGGEYREQTLKSLMGAPYKRIVVLHLAILLGGFGVMVLGSPLPLLLGLVGLKIGLDLVLHLREHRSSAARQRARANAPLTSRPWSFRKPPR